MSLSKQSQLELKQLSKGKKLLHPKEVIDFARDENTALHREFEWDDSKAAEKFRLQQARGILQIWVEVQAGYNEPTRVVVSLSSDRKRGGYRETSRVLSSKDMTATLFADAVAELVQWRERYMALSKMANFTALNAVFREIEKLAPRTILSK